MTTEKQQSRELTIAEDVEQKMRRMLPDYMALLPEHVSPQFFIRVTKTAIQTTPALQRCNPRSIIAACTRLAEMGLPPDGKYAALVAYNVRVSKKGVKPEVYEMQAKAMPMVYGLRDLVWRSGAVDDWKVRLVRKGDKFKHVDGDVETLTHESAYDDDAAITHVYSIGYLANGRLSRHVMTIKAVEKIRMRSRTPDDGPWKSDYAEMVKKTCLRQHSKALPQAKDIQTRERFQGALRALDDAEGVIEAGEGDRPAIEHRPEVELTGAAMQDAARDRLRSAVEADAFGKVHDDGERQEREERAPAAERKKPGPKPGSKRQAATPAPGEPDPRDDGRDPEFEEEERQRLANGSGGHEEERGGEEAGEADQGDQNSGGDIEAVKDAFRQGWQARKAKQKRIPPRTIRGDLVAAWFKGWDDFERSSLLGNEPTSDESSEAMLDQLASKYFV